MMISQVELFTGPSPDARKVSITLEELEIPYRIHVIDVIGGEQNGAAYRSINPHGKIPAIVAHAADGSRTLMAESAAIMIYLAESAGRLLPAGGRERYLVLEWMMFLVSGLGPTAAQGHHFRRGAPTPIPYAIERYEAATRRAYAELDERLGEARYLADNYSIADISCFPSVSMHAWQSIDLAQYPNLERWFAEMSARPGVQRGRSVP